MTVPTAGPILTPEEVAKIMQIKVRAVVRLCREGKLPGARKPSREWRVPTSAIETYYSASAPIVPRTEAGGTGDGLLPIHGVRPVVGRTRSDILRLLNGEEPRSKRK